MSLDRLSEALEQFVNSDDWEEARQVVEENKELLSEEATNLLAESEEDYRQADRNDVADYLEEHRAVLERGREVGIERAFAEAAARALAAMEKRKEQLEALRPTSLRPAQTAVWQLLDAEDPEEIDRVLSENPELSQDPKAVQYLDELMQRADEAGHEEARRFLRDYHDLLQAFYELPPLLLALQELMSVPTWTEARDVLKRDPHLLSDESLRTMDTLIGEAERQGDQATANALRAYRRILVRGREVGPDRAMEEVMQMEEPGPHARRG
jgi:hypothetical protein